MAYLSFLFMKKKITNKEIRVKLGNKIMKIKQKKNYYMKILITIIILIVLQLSLQWTIITKAKSLISKDTYFHLKNIYYLLDNQTICPDIKFYYPPGYVIFCSGALQISKDYLISYYFLKFGGIYILFLFILNIFFLTLRIFKRIYIAFICSILLLSFYLYIYRLNAFYPSSVSIFFLCISLIIFLENKKFLYYLGFLIPITFYFNPPVLFFNFILLFVFITLNLLYFDRKHYFKYFKIIIVSLVLSGLSFISYSFYLLYLDSSIFELFNSYFNSTTNLSFNSLDLNLFDLFQKSSNFFINLEFTNSRLISTGNIIENIFNFIMNLKLTIALVTILLYLFFSGLGFLFNPSDQKSKRICLLCKLSILLIIAFYISSILILHSTQFFSIFLDRIFAIFCPYIIILCGFGIYNLERIILKIINIINQKQIFKKLSFSQNKFFKKIFRIENVFIFLLSSSLISINFSQYELIDDFTHYRFEDNTVESYLYLRENVPKNSIILTPSFSLSQLMDGMLYDMEIIKSQFDMDTTFNEINRFVSINNIDYLLIKKSDLTQIVLIRLLNHDNYKLIMENSLYFILEVI